MTRKNFFKEKKSLFLVFYYLLQIICHQYKNVRGQKGFIEQLKQQFLSSVLLTYCVISDLVNLHMYSEKIITNPRVC